MRLKQRILKLWNVVVIQVDPVARQKTWMRGYFNLYWWALWYASFKVKSCVNFFVSHADVLRCSSRGQVTWTRLQNGSHTKVMLNFTSRRANTNILTGVNHWLYVQLMFSFLNRRVKLDCDSNSPFDFWTCVPVFLSWTLQLTFCYVDILIRIQIIFKLRSLQN